MTQSFRSSFKASFTPFAFLIIVIALYARPAHAQSTEVQRPASFSLANGLQIVVIPDRRTPVVTHMVWYKVGSADETPGKSGLAHFLEHLMFKGTEKNPAGRFSQTVSRPSAARRTRSPRATTPAISSA